MVSHDRQTIKATPAPNPVTHPRARRLRLLAHRGVNDKLALATHLQESDRIDDAAALS